jgi:predicted amidohydrolase
MNQNPKIKEKKMKIALIQLSVMEDMHKNLSKAMDFMETAASQGARLVCFPEVQLSPFFPQYPNRDASKYLITEDHKYMKMFQGKCKSLKVVGIPNVYLMEKNFCYDASPVIDADGTLLGISKMVHIVQAPCFFEQDYYQESDSGFKVYKTSAGEIGVVICFDRHLPESIRTCVLKGARLIVIPTANTRAENMEMFEWEVRVSAMQNGVFIAMCNRVGIEGEMDFCGESIVVDPNGDIVTKAGEGEQILYGDIDLSEVDRVRKMRPYLALRRPEVYER